jgi:hypothetical protein
MDSPLSSSPTVESADQVVFAPHKYLEPQMESRAGSHRQQQPTLDTFAANICYQSILCGSRPPTLADLVAPLPVTKY